MYIIRVDTGILETAAKKCMMYSEKICSINDDLNSVISCLENQYGFGICCFEKNISEEISSLADISQKLIRMGEKTQKIIDIYSLADMKTEKSILDLPVTVSENICIYGNTGDHLCIPVADASCLYIEENSLVCDNNILHDNIVIRTALRNR